MNREYKKYFTEVLRSIENKEIRDRIEYLLCWYNKRATRSKIKYYICASVGIIGPALITLISSCRILEESCLIPIISTVSTIFAGILVMTRWQEGWVRYRNTVEHIKSKLSIYIIEIQSMENEKKLEKDKEFIKEIEEIVQNENFEWSKIRNKDIKLDEDNQ